jgi:exosortase
MHQQHSRQTQQPTWWARRGLSAACGAALLAPILLLYAPSFAALSHAWQTDPNYSHGWLVVAASLFFAGRGWRRAGKAWQAEVRGIDLALGTVTLVIGLAMHFLAALLGMLLLDVLALIAILRGMLLALGGRRALRTFGFACLLLVFMAPLPVAWYQPLANLMQRLATSVSAAALSALGVPVFVEGYVFRLPGHSLELAEACSGLRQLTAFLALAVAVGHLTGRAAWFQAALAAISGLVALAANCVRVVAAVLVLWLAGPRWAQGMFHAIEGLVVVGLGLLMLIAAAWGLSALQDRFRQVSLAARPRCIAEG